MTNSNLRKYYIYEWFIKETDEVFYVGKGSGQRYKARKRENEYFMKMLNSHDCDVRKVNVNLLEDEAFKEEIKLISHYRNNTNFRLTNIADGGNQPPTYYGENSFSKLPEVKAKISKSNKEKWSDEKYRDKMSDAFEKFYNSEVGKKIASKRTKKNWENEEFRRKVIDNMTSTMRSDEFKQRHSKTMKEAYSSEEVREKVRGANNGASRKIKQYDLEGNLIAEFETLTKAYEMTGLHYKNISKALNSHRKTAYGYVWKFADDKEITYSKRKSYSKNVSRNRRAILQYDLNGNFMKEFESSTEAGQILKVNRVNIIKNLKGITKSAYGFRWKYKDEIQGNTVPSKI